MNLLVFVMKASMIQLAQFHVDDCIILMIDCLCSSHMFSTFLYNPCEIVIFAFLHLIQCLRTDFCFVQHRHVCFVPFVY